MTNHDAADSAHALERLLRDAGREIGERQLAFTICCAAGHGVTTMKLTGGERLTVTLPADSTKARVAIRDASYERLTPRGRRFRDGTRWRLDCRHPGCGASATVWAASIVAGCLESFRRGERHVRLK